MAFVVFLLVLLGLLGLGLYHLARRRVTGSHPPAAADESSYRVNFAPPEFEWSGTAHQVLTLKALTYKQHECLEDARNGSKIVGLSPSERKQPQPHKTRAHGLKTVASLAKHGFLEEDGDASYVITDHGLHALAVCGIRY